MGWTTYYQWAHNTWHFDDGRTGRLVTLCGVDYQAKWVDTIAPPKGVCKKCQTEMVRVMLQHGVPVMYETPNAERRRVMGSK